MSWMKSIWLMSSQTQVSNGKERHESTSFIINVLLRLSFHRDIDEIILEKEWKQSIDWHKNKEKKSNFHLSLYKLVCYGNVIDIHEKHFGLRKTNRSCSDSRCRLTHFVNWVHYRWYISTILYAVGNLFEGIKHPRASNIDGFVKEKNNYDRAFCF